MDKKEEPPETSKVVETGETTSTTTTTTTTTKINKKQSNGVGAKKRKTPGSCNTGNANTHTKAGKCSSDNNNSSSADPLIPNYYEFSLVDIKKAIIALSEKVPSAVIKNDSSETIRKWATDMQGAIEHFNLLLGCVSPAIYKWGSDRSGASDQNISLLVSEINSAQEQISSNVSNKLGNVLAPVVDIVICKTTKTIKLSTQDGEDEVQIKENEFAREKVDPEFVRFCEKLLIRDAALLRQVVLANFHKVLKVMNDFIKANEKDNTLNRTAYSF